MYRDYWRFDKMMVNIVAADGLVLQHNADQMTINVNWFHQHYHSWSKIHMN